MIALRRFLQPYQVGVELLLVEPPRTVDAAQHRVLLVASPIGAGHAGQLERLRIEFPRRRQMRPPATVDRSEEHTSELQSLMRISYAVFCLKKKQQSYSHQ